MSQIHTKNCYKYTGKIVTNTQEKLKEIDKYHQRNIKTAMQGNLYVPRG